jgi:hypothetical protein
LERITAQRQIYLYQGLALAALLVALLLIWLTSYRGGGNPPAPAATAFGQWVTYGTDTGAGADLFHKLANGKWQFTFPSKAQNASANMPTPKRRDR